MLGGKNKNKTAKESSETLLTVSDESIIQNLNPIIAFAVTVTVVTLSLC